MKKKVGLCFIACLLVTSLSIPVAADTPIKLFINNKASDVQGLLIDGRTYVPARYVSETFGANVDYVNGEVRISTANTKPVGQSASLNTKDLANLPVKNTGEKIQIGDISYSIQAVTYQTKGSKQYVKIMFREESNSSIGDFGLLPSFAYQQGNAIKELSDYSVTADSNAKGNTDYRRTFSYTFPCEGEISNVYYYPNGSTKAIGKWNVW